MSSSARSARNTQACAQGSPAAAGAVVAQVLAVGHGAEALGAEILEGDGHLLDEHADGLFEDAENLEVAVRGAFEEERYRVQGYEG